jgi:catechol-2,3-dioxygenase
VVGRLKTVVLDAPDIVRLSAFYQALAGWKEAYADDEWVTLSTDDGWRVGLQLAPDHVPPQWPDAKHPQQAHLDLRVPDLDEATARAEKLGATVLRRNETWHTLADPAGHSFDLCLNADDPRTTLMGVMLDCPDAKVLSTFYAELLGKPMTYEGDGMAMIGNEGEQPLLFQQVAEYTPPQWPDPAYPQQVHFDVEVTDIEVAEQAALALGATRLPGEGETWRVYADPASKPFCLTWTVDQD